MKLTKYQRFVLSLGMPIRYDPLFSSAYASDRYTSKLRAPTIKTLISMGLIEKTGRAGMQTDLYELSAAGRAALMGANGA